MSVVENQQHYQEKGKQTPLVDQVQRLPVDAFTHMRLLTPQTGCPNGCGFCSQGAGSMQFRLTESGLNTLFGAIKTVARARNDTTGALIGGWRPDRQGVIHPYYDNDVGSYPHLDTYLQHVSDLGAMTTISTVGWSRHNKDLQIMHERIANELGDTVSGVRFSWTPYTYGWTEAGARSGTFSREDMIADFANSLSTYRPLVEKQGVGVDQVHTEIRFRPLVESQKEDLVDTFIGGHHVIQSGPYLLISREKKDQIPPTAAIKSVSGRNIALTQDPSPYIMVVSDQQVRRGDKDIWRSTAQKITASLAVNTSEDLLPDLGESAAVKAVNLYRWENADGPYYAVDPIFDEATGEFTGKQFYDRTNKRKKSGYQDTERYFLNELLAYKREHGFKPSEGFDDATWEDADGVIDKLMKKAARLSEYDSHASQRLHEEIIPLVNGYRQALELAGYDASYFFNSHFTMDTGTSANQGRAMGEFRGLAATPDTPMSPWEDRFHGDTSIVSQRKNFWRWSPNPHIPGFSPPNWDTGDDLYRGTNLLERRLSTVPEGIGSTRKALTGWRNGDADFINNTMTVSELHPRTFTSYAPDGARLQHHTLTGVEIEVVTSEQSRAQYLQPGLKLAA